MISYPSLVRRATPDDIDGLMLFVPQVLAETTLLPISLAKVEELITRCATRQGGAIAGIIDRDGDIEAGIGLAFCESETSDIPFIRAVWCGLHPSLRRIPPIKAEDRWPNPHTNTERGGHPDPRAHYGRTLFQFARWCHEGLEKAAEHPILLQFDLLTKTMLGPKMGLYQRNLQQVGATFAFGAVGDFAVQKVDEAEVV